MTEVEMCWRCPTPMAWLHGTWICPNCKFKLGCCEGDPQTPCDAPQPAEREPRSSPVLDSPVLDSPVLDAY